MDHTEIPQPRQDMSGYPPRRRDLPYKIPTLAGILSALMPGLGQVYVGYFQLGITVGLIFAGCVTALSRGVEGFEPFFGLTLAFTYLFGIVDAARSAGAYNRYLDGMGSDNPPPEMSLPAWGGSRAGGILLIVVGVIAAANTLFEIDLEWLEDAWPLGLIGLGIWLFLKSRRGD